MTYSKLQDQIIYKLEERQMMTRLYANGDGNVKFPSMRFERVKIFPGCDICGQTLYYGGGLCKWCEENLA